MNDDTTHGAAAEPDYEPPVLFDLGSVYDITFGSSNGGGDASGQGYA
ncbi:hypothetical protein ACFWNN_12365 [Lentzea sp. NPDC058450]